MKWRTLQSTTSVQVVGVSHVLGIYAKGLVSHKLEVCALRERRLLQDQIQLGIEVKIQL